MSKITPGQMVGNSCTRYNCGLLLSKSKETYMAGRTLNISKFCSFFFSFFFFLFLFLLFLLYFEEGRWSREEGGGGDVENE